MNDLEKRWKPTGLLRGTKGIDSALLANNLNDCCSCLTEESKELGESDYLSFKAGTLYSIICRLFSAGIRVLNVRMLYGDYTRYMVVHGEWRNVDESEFIENYLEWVCTDDRIDAFSL